MSEGWELLFRWPGGTVAALATVGAADDGAPGGPLLAATAAGLHTSDDGGRSWRWLALGADPFPDALLAAPSFATSRIVLLGAGGGLHRSTDGGRTWRPILAGSRIQALAAAGDFTAGGTVLAGSAADGILRSDDGGLTWDGANAGLLDLNVTALALSPAFARDRTAFAGTASGLFRSRNGGRAWRLVEIGPDAPAIQAVALSPRFADDGLVLAGTEADGLFRSDDGGQSWEPVAGFPEPCVTALAIAPGRDGRVIVAAGTAAGVAVSFDGGHSWALEAAELGPILSLVVAGTAGAAGTGGAEASGTGSLVEGGRVGLALVAGTVGAGVVRRALPADDEPGGNDSGVDAPGVDEPGADEPGAHGLWRSGNDGLVGRATVGLAATTGYADEPLLAVAMLDGGAHLSHDGGRSWKTGQAGLADLAASSVALVGTAQGQPRLLATFAGGLFGSSDIEGGWEPVGAGPSASDTPTIVQAVGDTGGGTSLVVAAGPALLAYSTDGGESWRTVPPPGPGGAIVGVAASPDLGRDGTLYAVVRAAIAQADGTTATGGLELWHTDTFGRTWSRWLEAPDASVLPLVASRFGAGDAPLLVGLPGRVARPLAQARERRGGEVRPLWDETAVGSGPAARRAVTALAVSPRVRSDRTVLAAVDGAVYRSRDGGRSFAPFAEGLSTPLVTALALASTPDGVLHAYALGLGGTLWHRTV